MKPYRLHRDAEKEYAQAAEYYARIDLEPGQRFYRTKVRSHGGQKPSSDFEGTLWTDYSGYRPAALASDVRLTPNHTV